MYNVTGFSYETHITSTWFPKKITVITIIWVLQHRVLSWSIIFGCSQSSYLWNQNLQPSHPTHLTEILLFLMEGILLHISCMLICQRSFYFFFNYFVWFLALFAVKKNEIISRLDSTEENKKKKLVMSQNHTWFKLPFLSEVEVLTFYSIFLRAKMLN